MAEFVTLASDFVVRVNDGFTWAVYEIKAPTQERAFAIAAERWREDGNKTKISDKPLPEEAPLTAPDAPVTTPVVKPPIAPPSPVITPTVVAPPKPNG